MTSNGEARESSPRLRALTIWVAGWGGTFASQRAELEGKNMD